MHELGDAVLALALAAALACEGGRGPAMKGEGWAEGCREEVEGREVGKGGNEEGEENEEEGESSHDGIYSRCRVWGGHSLDRDLS